MMTAPRWVLAALIAVAAVMPRAGESAPFPIDPRASFDIVERGGAVGDNRTLNTEHITATIQMANATVVRGACACVRSCVVCALPHPYYTALVHIAVLLHAPHACRAGCETKQKLTQRPH
jgi:hypothetical protein